uniref:Uncharacterized protein n=1 Tax=Physcomitrium patens TaxID=3218 RepID=A0A2K1IBK2_PHYPA|nr:hypothetical protein PHYPA_030142 [Physcomitrium patens]
MLQLLVLQIHCFLQIPGTRCKEQH